MQRQVASDINLFGCYVIVLLAMLHHVVWSSPVTAQTEGRTSSAKHMEHLSDIQRQWNLPEVDRATIDREIYFLRHRLDDVINKLDELSAESEYEATGAWNDEELAEKRAVTFGRRLELPLATSSSGADRVASNRRESLGPAIRAMRYGRRR